METRKLRIRRAILYPSLAKDDYRRHCHPPHRSCRNSMNEWTRAQCRARDQHTVVYRWIDKRIFRHLRHINWDKKKKKNESDGRCKSIEYAWVSRWIWFWFCVGVCVWVSVRVTTAGTMHAFRFTIEEVATGRSEISVRVSAISARLHPILNFHLNLISRQLTPH